MAVVIPACYAQDYKAIVITNLNPVDILPIIWQVEAGDKKVYEHIEHLRVAEATRIRDMMRQYGAGNHSPEEYQQLMNRLNTGMTLENPQWYDNYETIWEVASNPSDHAHCERSILNALINHANFKVVWANDIWRYDILTEYVKDNPNSINIFWNSIFGGADSKEEYNNRLNRINGDNIKNLCKSKNFVIFSAWTNLKTSKKKIYNGEYEADEKWMYSLASLSNSNKNDQPDTHLLVTIATNKNWDINQTNANIESSKFPVWFANNVLFSGRGFPEHREWVIYWPSWRYTTSDTNYFNVALADLCFQMKADVADADELLEMIRSTWLTDYIRFDLNWDDDTEDIHDGHQPETQPLILMNPAGFFQKYLMPTDLPESINTNGTTTLDKGYYHGVIYQIPGAEVNIDGQWIPFTDENKDLILTQNPMNLNWRLNGNLLKNYNYKPWDTINGQIIAVDDQWNGLNLSQEISINVIEPATLVGDVNVDGAVDVADIATIINVMAGVVGNTSVSYKLADVNGDGTVDVADIATVIGIMAGATQ